MYSIGRNPVLLIEYARLNATIERISKYLYILLIKITPIGMMLPNLLITFGNYFVLNLGDESYFLALPLLYVFDKVMINSPK